MLKNTTAMTALLTSCAPYEEVNTKQFDFLEEIREETLLSARVLSDNLDTVDFEFMDLPVDSMELGINPVKLAQEDVQSRVLALPQVIDNFDVKDQIRIVDEVDGYCAEDFAACVLRFDYHGVQQNKANIATIVKEAKGVPVYLQRDVLKDFIEDYENLDPVDSLAEDYSQARIFCLWSAILGHELTHTAGLGHNKDYRDPSDPPYVISDQLKAVCMDKLYSGLLF